MPRRSVARQATIAGVGLHTGASVSVTLLPAPSDTGRVFRRVDIPGEPSVRATIESVTDSERRTVIASSVCRISTVEHLLAAIGAHSIDDVFVDVDGPELPAMDGSADAFVEALESAGVTEHDGTVNILDILEPMEARIARSTYRAAPYDGFRLTVLLRSTHPLIGKQTLELTLSRSVFKRELAGARTFGSLAEYPALRKRGLAAGATLENALVLTEDRLAGGALRWHDEFVRHKMLDLIGDLSLLDMRINAHVTAEAPSHRANAAFARSLFALAREGIHS